MQNSPKKSEEVNAEQQKQIEEANELALAFFDTIKKRDKQKPFKALKTIPKERFKANNTISLTIDEDQSIEFKFAGGVTNFRFAADTMAGLEPVKTFMQDFLQTFEDKHPDEKPFFELKAYSKESMDRTLIALQAIGIQVNRLVLVDKAGKEQVIDSPEKIQEYYSELTEPEDKPRKKIV